MQSSVLVKVVVVLLCCNPYTEHTDDGDDDLHIFDDADADFTVNWSLPIVGNIVHDLISYQASRYYEGSKDIGEAVFHTPFLRKLSAVDACYHVTLKVTWQNVPTALNKKQHSLNTIHHRK